jgi:hypothetical protein
VIGQVLTFAVGESFERAFWLGLGGQDARAARAFEPPPERAGGAGREDQKSISRM